MQDPKIIHLDKIEIMPQVREAMEFFGETEPTRSRHHDWARWSHVLSVTRNYNQLLDVGIGGGQFLYAAEKSGNFKSLLGADYKRHSSLLESGFKFVLQDITAKNVPASLRSDIVTCMECIEHLPGAAFDQAVINLKALAKMRLIITVPYRENPLAEFHHQYFDMDRLLSLFPHSEVTLLRKAKGVYWAMVDWAGD